MLQAPGDLRLEQEPRLAPRLAGALGADGLEGDLAAQFLVEGDEDLAQPAAGVRPEDAVSTAPAVGRPRRRVGAPGEGWARTQPGRLVVDRDADGLAGRKGRIVPGDLTNPAIGAGVAIGFLARIRLGGGRPLSTDRRGSDLGGGGLREDRLDQVGVAREAVAILPAVRLLAPLPPGRQLGSQQLPQQDRPSRLVLEGQDVFDPRPSAGSPGRLVAIAEQVDVICQEDGQGADARDFRDAHVGASSVQALRMTSNFRATVRNPQPSRAAISSLR